MELREYWSIIWRRWWVPVGLAAVVALAWLAMQRPWEPQPAVYTASLSFSVGIQPEEASDGEENYYTALTSEYLIDDIAEVVRGSEFAAAVSQRLAAQGIVVPAGAIQGSTQTGELHRILHVSTTWGNPDELTTIADAIAVTLQEDAPRFMPRLFAQNGAAYLVNRGGITEVGPGLRQRLDLPLRLFIAVLAGVALCFLWHYLDTSVRGRAQLEQMGLQVLGEIPRAKKR
jgi:capsular polysaccharide biosynthesis protein